MDLIPNIANHHFIRKKSLFHQYKLIGKKCNQESAENLDAKYIQKTQKSN